MADQQYCLRWNNHQPTLAGCFDRMLKDDQFTDCTLSAEGVNVVAHRMLLSACSPYFNELFKEYNKQQFPIVILRDVSVVELKALMDYMYRGEVNISQDQLADLLKVAEMLQIKGLYEAGFSESRASAPAPAASRVSMNAAVARPQPLDLPPDITSDGAASPAPRRRKRVRRRSSSDDFPSTIDVAAEPIGQAVAPATAKTEAVNNILSVSSMPVPPKLEEHQFDVVLPKEEYVDDQDSIENITLDDDDMDEMEQAGPSHGDGSSQGYPPSWHQSDRSTEDIFLSAQDSINNAGGAQRDSQALRQLLREEGWKEWRAAHPSVPTFMLESLINSPASMAVQSSSPPQSSPSVYGKIFSCPRCDRGYKLKSSLRNHEKWECGKEPQFQCPYCAYRAKQKMHVARHIERMHTDKLGLRAESGAEDTSSMSIIKDDSIKTDACNLTIAADGIGKEDLEKIIVNPAALLKSLESSTQK